MDWSPGPWPQCGIHTTKPQPLIICLESEYVLVNLVNFTVTYSAL